MKLLTNIFFILLFPTICFAHGITGTIDHGGVVVTALYDDGEPLNYAETTVIAPDADIPFSSGWTDRNGRFCFYPDVQGEYIVMIKDGIGHQLTQTVLHNATQNHTERNKKASIITHKANRPEKTILGISIIFFLFGFLFWWKGNRSVKKV